MSISYRKHDLYPEFILIRDFSGPVRVEDIIASWEHIVSNNLLEDTTMGIINNLSECDLQMDMLGFSTLMEYLRNQDYLKNVKLAVLCDNPKNIVFPKLAEKRETDLKIKPFSTKAAAEDWILDA